MFLVKQKYFMYLISLNARELQGSVKILMLRILRNYLLD